MYKLTINFTLLFTGGYFMTYNNKYQSYYDGDQSKIIKLDHIINEFIENYKVNTRFIPEMISGDILERCSYFNTIPNN